MQEMSSCFRSRTFCRADAGRFCKSIKIKMTGKTVGDLPHGEGDPGLRQQIQLKSVIAVVLFILY
jgi:hypothetical protein